MQSASQPLNQPPVSSGVGIVATGGAGGAGGTGGNGSGNQGRPPSRAHATAQRSESAPTARRLNPSSSGTRPQVARTLSRTEVVKNYIRQNTATFFGVNDQTEAVEWARWLERRKRLASRKYGEIRGDYRGSASRPLESTPSSRLESAYAVHQESPGFDETDSSAATRQLEMLQWDAHRHPPRRKDSVPRMAWDGMAWVIAMLSRRRTKPLDRTRSRSYVPSTFSEDSRRDETDHRRIPRAVPQAPLPERSDTLHDEVFFDKTTSAQPAPPADFTDAGQRGGGYALPDAARGRPIHPDPYRGQSVQRPPSWHRSRERLEVGETSVQVGKSRIGANFLDKLFDNSNRRQYGMGIVGKFFRRTFRRSVVENKKVQDQLEDLEDYRPYFTYWVTTVQLLILIISLACYGFGPFGVDLYQRSGLVLVTSLSFQQVDYIEPANFWLGSRAADLIHLGAKFAPCMRWDERIIREIETARTKERDTACCIRNDNSGCVQSSRADCSKLISTWKKWTVFDSGPGGRISGSVCGLDPKFCEAPASIAPYEWPDDITKWPICRKMGTIPHVKDKTAEHMVCEVIGHPCCIGIHGECRITTREYCDFVNGYFHEEASLCSQVSCLDDVCGMIPFYNPEVPDQFYRLWTSLFLHAGLFHFLITVTVQFFLMRDLEKMAGPLRIGIIYMGSGVAGNLASAIFVPYRAEVGPSGAQFGLLACLVVEVLNVWPMLKRPGVALGRLLSVALALFVLGLLPWVDNYAHLFGFIFGFLLSYALLPFVSFGPYDRQRKVLLIWVCLLSSLVLFLGLVILFYVTPVYDCEACKYLNCIPITRNFCASQNINLRKTDII